MHRSFLRLSTYVPCARRAALGSCFILRRIILNERTTTPLVFCFVSGISPLACCLHSIQCAGLLCEHDLVPVLGQPRPATEIGLGGTTGTAAVTTSCLVREVDLLVPGSLVMVTAGEGYAPDKACPCVTVASEIDKAVGVSGSSAGEASQGVEQSIGQGQGHITSPPVVLEASHLPPLTEVNNSVMDNEEVLVEMMDAETGLCLGKRVHVGDLRHSTSFFGRELDKGGTTVKQVLYTLKGRSWILGLGGAEARN